MYGGMYSLENFEPLRGSLMVRMPDVSIRRKHTFYNVTTFRSISPHHDILSKILTRKQSTCIKTFDKTNVNILQSRKKIMTSNGEQIGICISGLKK